MTAAQPVSRRRFLWDVLICALGAYGGPEAHFGVFSDHMVQRRGYLTQEELAELIALTVLLPGPSSTQTIAAIGYKVGGTKLALLTLLVWALPAILIMAALSFMGQVLEALRIDPEGLRYVGPMAVGFVAVAAWRIGRKVITDVPTWALFVLGAVVTYFFKAPWVYPLVLLLGGAVSVCLKRGEPLWNRVTVRPPWKYLAAFALLALGGIALRAVWDGRLVALFESFYRYGYLVIGGGQVVVPMMVSEMVETNGWLTSREFLTGFGLVQGLPGPMFSFSAYAGGMAARDLGALGQAFAAVMSGLAIFLPGILLIFFVYPIWESIKGINAVRFSLRGITAVAGGLIAAAAVSLMQKSGFAWDNVLVLAITVALLLWRKIPAPLIVLGAIIAGFVFR